MQLLGKDPDILVRAARKVEALGADIVDLNMGCPMPKITGKGKGAALMRDVPAAARILRAMRKAISVPLTVKIRERLGRRARQRGRGRADGRGRGRRRHHRAPADPGPAPLGPGAVGDHRRGRRRRRGPGDRQRRRPLHGRRPPDDRRDGLPVRDDRPRRARAAVGVQRGLRRAAPGGAARVPGPGHRPTLRADPRALPREVRADPDEEAPGVVHGGARPATDCRAAIFQSRSPAEVWEVFQGYWELGASVGEAGGRVEESAAGWTASTRIPWSTLGADRQPRPVAGGRLRRGGPRRAEPASWPGASDGPAARAPRHCERPRPATSHTASTLSPRIA